MGTNPFDPTLSSNESLTSRTVEETQNPKKNYEEGYEKEREAQAVERHAQRLKEALAYEALHVSPMSADQKRMYAQEARERIADMHDFDELLKIPEDIDYLRYRRAWARLHRVNDLELGINFEREFKLSDLTGAHIWAAFVGCLTLLFILTAISTGFAGLLFVPFIVLGGIIVAGLPSLMFGEGGPGTGRRGPPGNAI